jgi:hypothetical protein
VPSWIVVPAAGGHCYSMDEEQPLIARLPDCLARLKLPGPEELAELVHGKRADAPSILPVVPPLRRQCRAHFLPPVSWCDAAS